MDKRNWPWKKKSSSDKQSSEKPAANTSEASTTASETGTTQLDKVKQETSKKSKYVQISMESYSHLTGLEDQVKSYEAQVNSYEKQVQSYEEQVHSYEEQVHAYEEQVQNLENEVKDINEKLSEANTKMTDKENLVKQHAKVAEEAVSGWEKAEAEAATLKTHLESVTLLKLTAEDRASHLDGALKECMRKIRNLKEDNEQKIHEVVLNKTKLFDKMKLDLESKITDLDQELMGSAAENAALSRSLQERSNMLIQLSEEKSQAKVEIEHLKSNLESCEKDVNSLKYEVHIARKEVEIRNEEKNMSVRSAEVANNQHLEGVKKIAKLEAECQRLRGLVRKKLPGPASLAQMKLEVENLGRDYREPRLRRSPVKPPTLHSPQTNEFLIDGSQKYLKENELLTERLLAMEEETKMLKEALAKRNSELQASRSVYAQTASKLLHLEAQFHTNSERKSLTRYDNQVGPAEEIYSQRNGKPLSCASVSEDGNDDTVSCSGSWTTSGVMTELPNLKKDKKIESPHKSENANHLDLMDDFLEMEKLAYISNGTSVSKAEVLDNTGGNAGPKLVSNESLGEVIISRKSKESSQEDVTKENSRLPSKPLIFSELQSKISTLLELISNEKDMEKVIEDIRHIMQDLQNTLADGTMVQDTKKLSLSGNGETMSQNLQTAVTQIYNFIMILSKEANTVLATTPDGKGLNEKLDTFSAKYTEAITSDIDLIDFVLNTSHVLIRASELHFHVLGFKGSEVETGSSDCIDKIALPENKPVVDSVEERYSIGCARFSESASDPDVPNDSILVPTSESTATSWKCSLEEFEQLKMNKDELADELARCVENLENTKSRLLETEHVLAEVKSQLTSALKSNSLAQTQLKCMAESYKSLETRTDELKSEVNILQGKLESLDNELQEERICHQEALDRCKDLQEQLESVKIDSLGTAYIDDKTSQETELAAAAEKLAECQKTIFLLDKQLKSLRPQTDILNSPSNTRTQNAEPYPQEESTISGLQYTSPSETDTSHLPRAGSESPTVGPFHVPFLPSDYDANDDLLRSPNSSKYPKHGPTKSGSSFSSSTPTPEKQIRGFSRFFSPKEKNGQ